MRDLVNLIVDLRDERFDDAARSRARRSLESAPFRVKRASPPDDAFLAWIDDEFGGTWSSEAFAGESIVVRAENEFAGFASYDPRGLEFTWLRGLGAQPDVGIFGPFGVTGAFRGSAAGPNLLIAALGSLREAGYARALIPAVGEEKLVQYYARHAGASVAERFEKAAWQKRRYRTVVLASGSGTNFQSVVDGVARGRLPLDLRMLLSNVRDAYALERARTANVRAVTLPWDRRTQSRAEHDTALVRTVWSEEPDLILLLGWMHVLGDAFVAAFPGVINIHPAFLPLDQNRDEVGLPDGTVIPAFRGASAVRDALAWGSGWVGASAHRVTLDADRGPVLVRKPLAVVPGEGHGALMARLHPLEHRVLAGGIMRWVYER